MNRDDVTRMAREAGGFLGELPRGDAWLFTEKEYLERFAALVASAEREKLRGQIETLQAMYELASKQRDYLMDQQRAQVAYIRGEFAMNREDVIRMAREADLNVHDPAIDLLQRFAAHVVSAERERCTGLRKEVEMVGKHSADYEDGFWDALEKYENLIKAKGQA